MIIEKKERKTRSDKKRDVKPTVHESLYECVARISYITNTPMKEIAEHLCVNGLQSRAVIECLSKKFRRNYKFKNTLYIGKLSYVPERAVKGAGIRRRLPIRFQQTVHDSIGDLAYSLDMTISSTTALLLESSVKNTSILDRYVSDHVTSELDPARKKQLKEVLAFIQRDNPYSEEITLPRLISFIVDGVMDHTRNVKKSIEDWLDSVIEK